MASVEDKWKDTQETIEKKMIDFDVEIGRFK